MKVATGWTLAEHRDLFDLTLSAGSRQAAGRHPTFVRFVGPDQAGPCEVLFSRPRAVSISSNRMPFDIPFYYRRGEP